MLSNPLETLSYYKHGEQQLQPAQCASPAHPLPFCRHTPARTAHHREANAAPAAKTIWVSPGKPQSAWYPPPRQMPKASRTIYYIVLHILLSRTQWAMPPLPCPHPPSTTAGKANKRSAFLNTGFGAAALVLTGGLFEAVLTWARTARPSQHLLC